MLIFYASIYLKIRTYELLLSVVRDPHQFILRYINFLSWNFIELTALTVC